MLQRFPSLPRFALAAAAALALVAAAGFAQPKAETQPGTGPAPALSAETGVLVVSVEPGSPAEKAGIARGDIILEANGTKVADADELLRVIQPLKPGAVVSLKVRHGDAEKTLSVTLADQAGRALMGIVLSPPARAPLVAPRQRGGGGFAWDYPPGPGALIVRVVGGSPAEKAGLKEGDVVESVDGTAVDATHPLGDLVSAKKVGDTVTLSVRSADRRRQEAPREVKVTLEKNPDKDAPFLGVEYTMAGPGRVAPGLEAASGVFVAQVAENSPAAKAGIKANDVITAVEGVRVASPQDVSDAVAKHAPGDSLAITVYRPADGKTTDLAVTLGENPNDKTKAYMGVSMSGLPGFPGQGRRFMPGMPRFRALPPGAQGAVEAPPSI